MIRAFWFLIWLSALAAAVIWLTSYPAMIRIEWLDYTLSIHAALLAVAGLIAVVLITALHRLYLTILWWPRDRARKRALQQQGAGYAAISHGLACVAAGDVKAAVAAAKSAEGILSAEAPLLLLLQAQTARLQGNIPAMQRYYKVLSADKDAGFLGISGALRSALERQDLHAAAQLIEDGLKSHPRSPLLLQEAQSLALSQQDWDKALAVIKTQQAQKIISKAEAKAAMSTVLTQQADSLSDDKAAQAVALKKALKLTPKSPQLLYRLKDYLTHRQMKAKVLAAWRDRSTPQPERLLAQLWLEILPQSKNPLSSVKWAKQLIRERPTAAEGHYAFARILAEAGLRAEARKHAQQAMALAGEAADADMRIFAHGLTD